MRPGFTLEFEQTFEGAVLDADAWLAHYLPQWSTREASAARYELRDGQLVLRIDADQAPWCPELDGEVRVSSLQTGVFAGPVGSSIGQHGFNPLARVREPVEPQALYTPHFGLVEIRCRAVAHPRFMVALWMIGYEDAPDRSAEICVCEIFGRDVDEHGASVGVGVHPHGDPNLVDEFSAERVALDVRDPHVYCADWTPERIVFSVDDRVIKTVHQSPSYPHQLMLSIYELPEPGAERPARDFPQEFAVDYVRGWRRDGGYA